MKVKLQKDKTDLTSRDEVTYFQFRSSQKLSRVTTFSCSKELLKMFLIKLFRQKSDPTVKLPFMEVKLQKDKTDYT